MSERLRTLLVMRHYEELVRPAHRVLAEQMLTLSNYLDDVGIRGSVHVVTSRVKTVESIVKSMESGRYARFEDFPDLAGIRVVVHAQQDVDVVAHCFLRQVEVGKEMKLIRDVPKDEDGYRARHLDLEVSGSYRRSVFPVRMEVQIRTLSEDLYDTLSRAYWYKRSNVDRDESDRAALIEHLSAAEVLVSRLRERADDLDALEPERLMTPDSFQRIVKEVFQEDVPLSEASSVAFERDRWVRTNQELRATFGDPERKAQADELAAIDPKRKRYRLCLLLKNGFPFEEFKQMLMKNQRVESDSKAGV